MKRSFCLVFYFLFLIEVYPALSQNAKNPQLDSHRNFKEIRLGDNIENWMAHLTKVDSSTSVHEYLFDLRRCCNKVFDRNVQYLLIVAKDDKIVALRIYLVDFLDGKLMATIPEIKIALSEMASSYYELVNEFNDQFGPSVRKSDNGELVTAGKAPTQVHQWKGTSTLLTMELFMTNAVYGNEKDPTTGFTIVLSPLRESTVISLTDLVFLNAEKKAGF